MIQSITLTPGMILICVLSILVQGWVCAVGLAGLVVAAVILVFLFI